MSRLHASTALTVKAVEGVWFHRREPLVEALSRRYPSPNAEPQNPQTSILFQNRGNEFNKIEEVDVELVRPENRQSPLRRS